jgi:hypothetical protein
MRECRDERVELDLGQCLKVGIGGSRGARLTGVLEVAGREGSATLHARAQGASIVWVRY